MHNEIANEFGFSSPVFYLKRRRLKGAESNVSRMARTCWKYQIPPTQFYNHFIKDGAKINRSFFNFEVASHMNSYTAKTVEIERKLNRLLGQSDEEYFSYRFMHGLLDRNAHGFIAERKQWCARCYDERHEAGNRYRDNGIFDDLYWSVGTIKICMLHSCSLREKCQHCFNYQPYISTTSEPGFCHYCSGFLGGGYSAGVDEEELSRQRMLFHLFYISTYDEFRPDFERFSSNLRALQEAYPEANSEYLGRVMGCGDDVVRNWVKGRRKPKIESLFMLQRALGFMGPHQLFSKDKYFVSAVALAKNLSLNFNTRSRFRDLMKEVEIKQAMEAMICGQEETVSRSDLAERFGVTTGYLASRYRMECTALSDAHRHRGALEKEKRDTDLSVMLDRAFTMCRSRRNKWTIENIVKELPDGALDGMEYKDIYMAVGQAKERFANRKKVAA